MDGGIHRYTLFGTATPESYARLTYIMVYDL